ncbi:hypothetical protein C7974DRAFT_175130 [Boeremia exigua]|uniref:uncharacterized protein n=1 Tax=Boeremia exigua TaxID=749465 RepID=UPI001E8E00E6|nr:uncharacterized protein C7974DRAFT_175130 [Boeremia exigua]KAH6633602.1 hypothetical protein C7974DRAFT_175130 [Boeremia exigua]
MAASPRKRSLSPRKRLPPTPFNQTWHEADAAHLDPSALPVARIPRGWERKREVKQGSEGKAKSIWRRIDLRSSIAGAQQDETEEEERDALSRAVKRRQKMSPKAMEKMQGNKRAFQGTRWETRKNVLPRKRSLRNSDTINQDQSDSDDTQDATDADMSHDSLAEASHVQANPASFTFAGASDYEGQGEQEDEQNVGDTAPEDSTFALIFRSPVKSTSRPMITSPAKVDYPALPNSEEQKAQLEEPSELPVGEDVTVTGSTTESIAAEVDMASGSNTSDAAETYSAIPEAVESWNAEQAETQPEDEEEVAYPALPMETTLDNQAADPQNEDFVKSEGEDDDTEMSEVHLATFVPSLALENNQAGTARDDDEITEASLQLNIQEEYEREGELASQPPTPKPVATASGDIADGLTLALTPAKASTRGHTPKKLHSPPPPLRIESGPDDATMTLAIDDDTAILKSFLSRAAASKAERSAFITRRSSLENRRDSDIVRHALASPRRALEEKDPNSPTKADAEATLDLLETPVPISAIEESAPPVAEQPEEEDDTEVKSGRVSRRSSRAKKSRLPAPASVALPQTNKIAIRRADGSDPVVLKKTDAQELALITRNNTRKNKQGAFMVSLRLLKIQAEAILSPSTDVDADVEKPSAPGRRGIRWDETLAYYQEHGDTIAAQQAEAESLATPDELSLPVATTKKPKAKTSTDKTSTPKVRRVRGLGTVNGTPGKGLLATGSLLPDDIQEEKVAVAQPAPTPTAKGIPKPKATKRLPVPSTPVEAKPAAPEVKPVAVEPVKERKSRIAAPKSVRLPKPLATTAPVVVAEKENNRSALNGATPRKGIPAPRIMAPKAAATPASSLSGESGLPRRRGRKA